MMKPRKLNLLEITNPIKKQHSNFILEDFDNYCIRVAVFTGEYEWHYHPNSDEIFMVIEGQLLIDLINSTTIEVNPNEIVKIPAGILHKTRSKVRTVNLCFEKKNAETVFTKDDIK